MERKSALFVLAFLAALLLPAVPARAAATISGAAYSWESLERPAGPTVFEINTTPPQRIVSANGTYSFEVDGPGRYRLVAKVIQGGELELLDSVVVSVQADSSGEYNVDFLMFPPALSSDSYLDGLDFFDSLPSSPSDFSLPGGSRVPVAAVAIFLVAAAAGGALLILMRSRCRRSGEQPRAPAAASLSGQPSHDVENVLQKLREADGRMMQRELRKQLPFSEAKTSLIVSELEGRGLIRKFKRGRGNLLVVSERPGSGGK